MEALFDLYGKVGIVTLPCKGIARIMAMCGIRCEQTISVPRTLIVRWLSVLQ